MYHNVLEFGVPQLYYTALVSLASSKVGKQVQVPKYLYYWELGAKCKIGVVVQNTTWAESRFAFFCKVFVAYPLARSRFIYPRKEPPPISIDTADQPSHGGRDGSSHRV